MGIILLLLLGLSSFGFHSGFITASTEQISLYTGVTSTLTICTTLLFPSPPPYLNPRPFEATPVFSVFSSLRHGDVWIATRAREPSQPELPRSDKILQIVIYTRLYYSRSRIPFRAHAVIPQHSQSESLHLLCSERHFHVPVHSRTRSERPARSSANHPCSVSNQERNFLGSKRFYLDRPHALSVYFTQYDNKKDFTEWYKDNGCSGLTLYNGDRHFGFFPSHGRDKKNK